MQKSKNVSLSPLNLILDLDIYISYNYGKEKQLNYRSIAVAISEIVISLREDFMIQKYLIEGDKG
ncbi:hypothetical protein [Orenia marismortui]|uniref:hypothetical protein n=1 Tax=Orenia marismortui TaxID=46469 RepID=UPI001416FCE6|nr:hypothetical protein [Orenia marismortui]